MQSRKTFCARQVRTYTPANQYQVVVGKTARDPRLTKHVAATAASATTAAAAAAAVALQPAATHISRSTHVSRGGIFLLARGDGDESSAAAAGAAAELLRISFCSFALLVPVVVLFARQFSSRLVIGMRHLSMNT